MLNMMRRAVKKYGFFAEDFARQECAARGWEWSDESWKRANQPPKKSKKPWGGKKMREFVKEANELYYAEVEQMRSQAQPVQVDACSHELVSLSNPDTSNYSAHEQCSKCGKTHLIPRSN